MRMDAEVVKGREILMFSFAEVSVNMRLFFFAYFSPSSNETSLSPFRSHLFPIRTQTASSLACFKTFSIHSSKFLKLSLSVTSYTKNHH